MRFRFRYGLRWFLLLPLVVCIFLGLEQRRADQQRQLADELLAINGSFVRIRRPFIPAKICDMMPEKYGKSITEVTAGGLAAPTYRRRNFIATGITVADLPVVSTRTLHRLAALPAMRKVETFWLVGTSVDNDLANTIAALPGCKTVEVHGTAVTQVKYHPPAARFSFNGQQALAQNHREALAYTDDLQIFALAYEEDPESISKLLTLRPTRPGPYRYSSSSSYYNLIVDTLLHITSTEAILAVRQGLSEPNKKTRMTAVRILSRCDDSEGLIEALDDENSAVRLLAIRGVIALSSDEIHDRSRLNDGMLACAKDSDPAVRWSIMNWLPQSDDNRCFEIFVEALKDDDSAVRSASARGLGMLGDARAIPHLRKALESPDPFVTNHAEHAIDILEGL